MREVITSDETNGEDATSRGDASDGDTATRSMISSGAHGLAPTDSPRHTEAEPSVSPGLPQRNDPTTSSE